MLIPVRTPNFIRKGGVLWGYLGMQNAMRYNQWYKGKKKKKNECYLIMLCYPRCPHDLWL